MSFGNYTITEAYQTGVFRQHNGRHQERWFIRQYLSVALSYNIPYEGHYEWRDVTETVHRPRATRS